MYGWRDWWKVFMGPVNLDGRELHPVPLPSHGTLAALMDIGMELRCSRSTWDLSPTEIKALFHVIVYLLKIFHVPITGGFSPALQFLNNYLEA